MIDDIIEFLPKYPNIVQEQQELFNPYNNEFYENIYHKKEFYDEKLDKTEEFPEEVGELLKHQKIIARFFTSHTNYDQLLLVHEMGTGKSCSAIGAIEQIKADGGFKGALYLAKGDALVNNFMNELIFKCTDGRYIPEDYDNLTKIEQVHRKKKAIRDYYSFNTFETFAKYIKKVSDDVLRKEYSNHVIIIDEVHNLRIQEKVSGLNIYDQFFRFLHVVEGCKVLLMSGTPMKDNVKEISSVMNLILPLRAGEPFLSVGDEFVKEYFNELSTNIFKPKEDKISDLKKAFKGRVSFLQAMESNVKKQYVGKHMGTLKHFKVVADKMSDFQEKVYKEAYDLDVKGDKEGVYSNSRQAILFVFPDKTFGKEGFEKNIKKNKTGILVDDDGNKKSLTSFSLSPSLRSEIKGKTDEETLEKLEKFSSKYANTIRNILRAKEEGKCVFVYNEFVYGGGLILLGLILELFGFSKATGKERDRNEAYRYASLTNVTSTTTQIRDIVNRFNKKDNVRGKIINVIMGSRKISEGFSFQNIQIEEIQTPWFNYSETAQAIARGLRLGSHRMLIESGVESPTVDIYQRVSTCKNIEKTVDLQMYELSEDKDISIKSVERIIKESAFDCALTYRRNMLVGKDGERECEYMDCIYNCDGISKEVLLKNELDYTTYQLYYNDKVIQKIISDVKDIFRKIFSMDLSTIKTYFEEYNDFEIITALRTMVNQSIVVINKYGFTSYIKESNNIYFLIDNLSLKGKISSDYYTQYPHINIMNNTFNDIIDPIYYKSLPMTVDNIFKSTNIIEIRKLIKKLPSDIVEYIIEQSLIAQQKNVTMNKESRDILLEYFNNFYENIDGVLISSYLYDKDDRLRCLKNNVWEDCNDKNIEKYLDSKKQYIVDMENNPYGYYGQLNRENDKFCIRDVSDVDMKEGKKNKKTSGKVCSTWNVGTLYDIVINNFKLPLPDEQQVVKYLNELISKANKKLTGRGKKVKMPSLTNTDELWNLIKQFKNIDTMFNDVKDKLTGQDMITILYWGTKKKEELCKNIQEWFDEKGLLVMDNGCGSGDKKKV